MIVKKFLPRTNNVLSRVRMLQYLVKHLRHNITQKRSNVNDAENPSAFCELLHLIRYVLNTKNLGLKLKPLGMQANPGILCVSAIVITLEIPSAREV